MQRRLRKSTLIQRMHSARPRSILADARDFVPCPLVSLQLAAPRSRSTVLIQVLPSSAATSPHTRFGMDDVAATAITAAPAARFAVAATRLSDPSVMPLRRRMTIVKTRNTPVRTIANACSAQQKGSSDQCAWSCQRQRPAESQPCEVRARPKRIDKTHRVLAAARLGLVLRLLVRRRPHLRQRAPHQHTGLARRCAGWRVSPYLSK